MTGVDPEAEPPEGEPPEGEPMDRTHNASRADC